MATKFEIDTKTYHEYLAQVPEALLYEEDTKIYYNGIPEADCDKALDEYNTVSVPSDAHFVSYDDERVRKNIVRDLKKWLATRGLTTVTFSVPAALVDGVSQLVKDFVKNNEVTK